MSGRRRATLFEDLPEEIVVDQILIRLPSKDVGRCRAVSTSWRTATSTPKFMLDHHRRQPSLPIFDGQRAPASFVIFGNASADSSSQQQLWPFLQGFIYHYEMWLYGACDGLLLVCRGSRFYMCNPVIRKHALLSQPQVGQPCLNDIIGFYRYHPTGEYRVLWVSQKSSICSLYVLTVGSEEPRHVTVTMPAVSSPSLEQKLLKELGSSYYSVVDNSRRNVLSQIGLNGSLHWCPKRTSDIMGAGEDIIVFATEAESFRWMRSPAQLCSSKKLFNMKGMLALWAGSTPSFTAMDVWVMQDYEAEIWTLKYRIDVSMLEASRQLYLISFINKKKKKRRTPLDSMVQSFNDMAVLNERELLIKFNEKHVLHCDIDGKFLGIVNLGKSQYLMSLTQHRLQESIVPIPHQEVQEEDEDSLFSPGHIQWKPVNL